MPITGGAYFRGGGELITVIEKSTGMSKQGTL